MMDQPMWIHTLMVLLGGDGGNGSVRRRGLVGGKWANGEIPIEGRTLSLTPALSASHPP